MRYLPLALHKLRPSACVLIAAIAMTFSLNTVSVSGQTGQRMQIAVIDKQRILNPEKGASIVAAAKLKLEADIQKEAAELRKQLDALNKEIGASGWHAKSPEQSRVKSELSRIENTPQRYFESRWKPTVEPLRQRVEEHLKRYAAERRIDHVIDTSAALFRNTSVIVAGQGDLTEDFLKYVNDSERCKQAKSCPGLYTAAKPMASAPKLAYFDSTIAANPKTGLKRLVDGYANFNAQYSKASSAVDEVKQRRKVLEDKIKSGSASAALTQQLVTIKAEEQQKISELWALSPVWSTEVDTIVLKMYKDLLDLARAKGFDVIIDPKGFKSDEDAIVTAARQNDLTKVLMTNFNGK